MTSEKTYTNTIMLKLIFFYKMWFCVQRNNYNACFCGGCPESLQLCNRKNQGIDGWMFSRQPLYTDIKKINYEITLRLVCSNATQVICIKSQTQEANALGLYPVNVLGSQHRRQQRSKVGNRPHKGERHQYGHKVLKDTGPLGLTKLHKFRHNFLKAHLKLNVHLSLKKSITSLKVETLEW